MEYKDKEYCIEVRGDFACFTRPEMKVERVSYDVITPSSARAIFQAIYWKPAFQWQITRIEILNPIKKICFRRNEIGATMSSRSSGLFIEDKRQQKSSYLLRDVAYRLFAKMLYTPVEKRTKACREEAQKRALKGDRTENPKKYQEIFERRAAKGQCFTMPYLGCREFSCAYKWIKDAQYGDGIDESRSLGYMLYDMDFESNVNCPPAMFFDAVMTKGVIMVPPKDSKEVLR
ncbi:type I-C CRISPR-associated protein Cas5c [Porphyromonas pogonae]|uniref:type I-C CRISPR-associated protein Cas5c n=1 Tax=Porphyromonas pogonae TaxID=867595 RepID=UPI002E769566|nr:type I-C CRISPR-associated protein Cas5c [Porphyromonas pogonae]